MMTAEKMREIIEKNISFDSLGKDKGICVFYEAGTLSVGISFESESPDGEEMARYIYNLFLGDEYVNIGGYGTLDNPLPDDVIQEMVQEWNVFEILDKTVECSYEEVKSLVDLVSKGFDAGLVKVVIDDYIECDLIGEVEE